jgi:serine/threonine protein kinase
MPSQEGPDSQRRSEPARAWTDQGPPQGGLETGEALAPGRSSTPLSRGVPVSDAPETTRADPSTNPDILTSAAAPTVIYTSVSERDGTAPLSPPQRCCTSQLRDKVPAAPFVQLGPYRVFEELGRGGMSVVFRGEHPQLGRIVAIKTIPSYRMSREAIQRFQRGSLAAARLAHPNVVQLFDAGYFLGQPYLVMEYVEGGSVASLLQGGPLAPDRAAEMLAQVADAVAYLHQQGIIHRDLKPSNILLDKQGRPKLSDFDLVKLASSNAELTRVGQVTGTPAYMAPEQGGGDPNRIGPTTDVYGLGACLYAMLTGQPPRANRDLLIQTPGSVPPDPVPPRKLNPAIPAPLELICLRCLESRPEARYPSASEVAEELRRYLRGEPVRTPAPTIFQQALRWARRHVQTSIRLTAMAFFYSVEFLFWLLGNVSTDVHIVLSFIVAAWASITFLLHRLQSKATFERVILYIWGGSDVLFLTLLLWQTDGVASPLIVGYLLLIFGSALWQNVPYVWLITSFSVVAYGLLSAAFLHAAFLLGEIPLERRQIEVSLDRHLYFLIALWVAHSIAVFLARRLSRLADYCQRLANA